MNWSFLHTGDGSPLSRVVEDRFVRAPGLDHDVRSNGTVGVVSCGIYFLGRWVCRTPQRVVHQNGA